jgi:hypothetical protein
MVAGGGGPQAEGAPANDPGHRARKSDARGAGDAGRPRRRCRWLRTRARWRRWAASTPGWRSVAGLPHGSEVAAQVARPCRAGGQVAARGVRLPRGGFLKGGEPDAAATNHAARCPEGALRAAPRHAQHRQAPQPGPAQPSRAPQPHPSLRAAAPTGGRRWSDFRQSRPAAPSAPKPQHLSSAPPAPIRMRLAPLTTSIHGVAGHAAGWARPTRGRAVLATAHDPLQRPPSASVSHRTRTGSAIARPTPTLPSAPNDPGKPRSPTP